MVVPLGGAPILDLNRKPKRNLFKINLYPLAMLVAGFYIGYNEGKGIDTSGTVEYLTKYGPTAFVLTTTPLIIKVAHTVRAYMHQKVYKNMQEGNLEVILGNGPQRRYGDLNEFGKLIVEQRLNELLFVSKLKMESEKYLKNTIVAGTRAAVITMVGYAAGRLYSQINLV